ncbi:hypothetical protein MHEI_42930 [Mycobacterium heidelbergense]|nr:hypothetical protein MHEI_42930 [Mycobacterium heidelbergense]
MLGMLQHRNGARGHVSLQWGGEDINSHIYCHLLRHGLGPAGVEGAVGGGAARAAAVRAHIAGSVAKRHAVLSPELQSAYAWTTGETLISYWEFTGRPIRAVRGGYHGVPAGRGARGAC